MVGACGVDKFVWWFGTGEKNAARIIGTCVNIKGIFSEFEAVSCRFHCEEHGKTQVVTFRSSTIFASVRQPRRTVIFGSKKCEKSTSIWRGWLGQGIFGEEFWLSKFFPKNTLT